MQAIQCTVMLSHVGSKNSSYASRAKQIWKAIQREHSLIFWTPLFFLVGGTCHYHALTFLVHAIFAWLRGTGVEMEKSLAPTSITCVGYKMNPHKENNLFQTLSGFAWIHQCCCSWYRRFGSDS